MDFIAEGFIQAFRMLLTMDEETTVIVVTTFKLTALSVGEVGRAVGYPNQLHFSRAFKSTFGLCPREWRRENAKV